VQSAGRTTLEALAIDSDKKLYLGGRFEKAGDINANNIAIYDTKTDAWSTIGSGINGIVYKIVIWGDSVVFCGSFESANGDSNIKNIAFWNKKNGTWSGLGQRTNGSVYTIIKWYNDLYIGGAFTKAGGVDAAGVAKFNSASSVYESLGSGLRWGLNPGTASALIVYKNALYVGGMFLSAGGKVSTNFARWKKIKTEVPEIELLRNEPEMSISPNPASNLLHITISLTGNENCEVSIFNSFGLEVGTIANKRMTAGSITINYNIKDREPGLYFVRLRTDGFNIIKKVIVVN